MEAALCLAYAPRDPILEFFEGRITLRHLRVLIEGLPPDNAVTRAINGSHWVDSTWLLHDVSSQLRNLNASVHNIVQKPPVKPQFLPTPELPRSAAEEADEAQLVQQRAEMDALLIRIDPDKN